jgi:integrase/recombinase XerD
MGGGSLPALQLLRHDTDATGLTTIGRVPVVLCSSAAWTSFGSRRAQYLACCVLYARYPNRQLHCGDAFAPELQYAVLLHCTYRKGRKNEYASLVVPGTAQYIKRAPGLRRPSRHGSPTSFTPGPPACLPVMERASAASLDDRTCSVARRASRARAGWTEVIAAYLDRLQVIHYAPDTVQVRACYLRYFAAWAETRGIGAPGRVTRGVMEGYQRWLHDYRKRTGAPLSVSSQHGRLLAVRSLFVWLAQQGRIRSNPATELELPRMTAQRLPQPLTEAEIARVLARPDPSTPTGLRDRALLETVYSTGLRRMELIRLRCQDLDLARGVCMIREGKGKKDRVVPIGERAADWLLRYLGQSRPTLVAEPDHDVIFLTTTGRPFHPNHCSRLIREHIVAAGIRKRGACHLLRHTMATAMLEHGADVRVIQEILGHARLTTTQLYTRVSIRLLKAVHTATHPAARARLPSPAVSSRLDRPTGGRRSARAR